MDNSYFIVGTIYRFAGSRTLAQSRQHGKQKNSHAHISSEVSREWSPVFRWARWWRRWWTGRRNRAKTINPPVTKRDFIKCKIRFSYCLAAISDLCIQYFKNLFWYCLPISVDKTYPTVCLYQIWCFYQKCEELTSGQFIRSSCPYTSTTKLCPQRFEITVSREISKDICLN